MNCSELIKKNLGLTVRDLLNHLLIAISSHQISLWLVGGTIRDLLEGRTSQDIDLAFTEDMTPLVRRWAKQQGGSWFWLDSQRNQSRVIFNKVCLQFDFSPLRAETIHADLRLRDFTLNAMALELSAGAITEHSLIDPLKGFLDLQRGVLRSCGPQVLNDDPLRVLKGIRHHALQGWQIETQTLKQMSLAAPQLVTVAGERLRSELGLIFASGHIKTSVEIMEDTGVLKILLPGINLFGQGQKLELLLARLDRIQQQAQMETLLQQPLEEGICRKALLILSSLLRTLKSSDDLRQITRHLRFSTICQSTLRNLYLSTIDLNYLNHQDSQRVKALKVEALGRSPIEQMLYALITQESSIDDLLVLEYLNAYTDHITLGKVPHLLDGHQLIALNATLSGAKVGAWQAKIKTAEIAGEISKDRTVRDWLLTQFSN